MKLVAPEEIARQYDRNVQAVLEDVTLRREYQEQMVEKLYSEAREQIQNQIDREREELEVALRAARRLAFSCPEVPGNKDKVLLMMHYTKHLEKVAEIDSQQALERYLQRVTLVDDIVGIKAVLTRAFELSLTDTVNKVLAEYPEWEEAFTAFQEASIDLRDYSRSPHAFFGAGRLRSPREYLT
jgi:hypothetical protein